MKTRIFYVVMALVLTVALAVPLLSPGTAVTADTVPKTQLAMILDGSFSISESEWDTIIDGLADAVGNVSCVPQDGSVELTVIQFSDNARLEVGPVVITTANADAVAADIQDLDDEQMGDWTCIACGICLAADTLAGSLNFSTTLKQALNLVTDGEPNMCIDCGDCTGECEGAYCLETNARTSAETARNYAIGLLGMDTDPQDEFDAEFIGTPDGTSTWLKDEIVWPEQLDGNGYYAPPFDKGGGWVRVVADADEFAETICEKFQIIVEPTGACCDPATGICTNDVLEADCQDSLEWTDGVLCANLDPPCALPTGACCDRATGSCTDDVFEADCQGTLEEWTDGILCANLEPQCEPPRGACCDLETGSCTDDVFEADCQGTLEEWTDGVLCANLEPQCEPPRGACCNLETGICTNDVLEADCPEPLLEWNKDKSCAEIVCEPPTGACCNLETGICTNDVLEADCPEPLLEWNKDKSCAEIVCEPPKGACCDRATGSCTDDVFEADCQDSLEWTDGVLCANLEPQCEPPRGACCDWATGICTDDVFEADCQGTLEEWTEDKLCANLEPLCAPPPEELDFGDAPEEGVAYPPGVMGKFPTCMTVGPSTWIQHGLGWAHFGPAWDPETDGDAGLCPGCFPTYDDDECFADGDAGLIVPEPSTIDAGGTVVTCPNSAGTPLGFTCHTATWGTDVDIWVVNNMPSEAVGYVNVLMDWNQDGQWAFDPSTTCAAVPVPEHVLVNQLIPAGYIGPLSGVPGGVPTFTIGPNPGYVWTRFTISERPVGMVGAVPLSAGNNALVVVNGVVNGWHGEGEFEDGETEDYLLSVYEPPPPQVVTGVPTLSQWGMIAMGILFAAFLIWTVRRRWVVSADGSQE